MQNCIGGGFLLSVLDSKHPSEKWAQKLWGMENHDLHIEILSGGLSPKVYAECPFPVPYPINPSLRRTFDIVRLAK